MVEANERMPAAFVSHGAPLLAVDRVSGADFRRMAEAMRAPRAVLVFSAHWTDAPATIGTIERRSLLHDFSGFPRELDAIRYDAPVASDLAARVASLIDGIERDDERPWDHGVWVPLLHMYPRADIPVLQVSLPVEWPARRVFELGERLAPLRDEGVLVLGSGGAVHNLGRLDWSGSGMPPAWASEFEAWLRDRIAARAIDDVVAFRERGPASRLAHPTIEHFVPLLIALGAGNADANATASAVSFPIEGFEYGSLSRLAVRFG